MNRPAGDRFEGIVQNGRTSGMSEAFSPIQPARKKARFRSVSATGARGPFVLDDFLPRVQCSDACTEIPSQV